MIGLGADHVRGSDAEAQSLVNCLQVLELLLPAVHADLLPKVRQQNTLTAVALFTSFVWFIQKFCSLESNVFISGITPNLTKSSLPVQFLSVYPHDSCFGIAFLLQSRATQQNPLKPCLHMRLLTLSLLRSKSTFSQPFKNNCV